MTPMINIPINNKNAPSIDIALAIVAMSHSPNAPDCVSPKREKEVNKLRGILGFQVSISL